MLVGFSGLLLGGFWIYRGAAPIPARAIAPDGSTAFTSENVIVVVAGSMAGGWLGAAGLLGNLWFLFGHQGWEYLELGRIWQVLLAVGLGLWLVLLFRGLQPALKGEGAFEVFAVVVIGFLINLPIVNYFEHGSFLTAAHGHAALAGVYGMLGVALLLFALRNVIDPEWWDDRLPKIALWGLNGGLAGMLVVTLVPVGFMQLGRSYEVGLWSARSLDFHQVSIVQALLWARIVPDLVFIAAGVLPLAYLALRGLWHLRASAAQPVGRIASVEDWVTSE